MQEPVDIRRRKTSDAKSTIHVDDSHQPEVEPVNLVNESGHSDHSNDQEEYNIPQEVMSSIDGGDTNSICSNETIVIDDSDDDQLDDKPDLHQIKLRSKIAQQLWVEQNQHQHQLQQQQQQRRHRARNSRNRSTITKVNNLPTNRSKRVNSSKIISQGNFIERSSTASDHDGDIDNSDNGYEEEDRDSDDDGGDQGDDRDRDVREIYNQGIVVSGPSVVNNTDLTDGAGVDSSSASVRGDKLKQDKSNSLRRRTRAGLAGTRDRLRHEDFPSNISLNANHGSEDSNYSFNRLGARQFLVCKDTDYNNNSKLSINRNHLASSPDTDGTSLKPRQVNRSLKDPQDYNNQTSKLSEAVSRAFDLILGDRSSASHELRAEQTDGLVKGARKNNAAQIGKSFQRNLDKVNEWREQQELVESTSGKRKRENISAMNENNYYSLSGPGVRKSFKGTRQRDTFNITSRNGYQKLGYNFHHESPKSSFLHEFKRFLLLLIIIAACGFVLWQLYLVLIEEDNFLGVDKYSPSELGKFSKYAVSTDAAPCAKIGKDLLAKGGHAVDAAIGTLLCMGVVLPNSLGLGGGCLMTIYDNVTKTATVIDGRETAPDYATENMFAGNPLLSSRGPLSVGVPGELAAYWEAHQRFGRLKWSELFDATIELAETGFETVEHLSFALRNLNHAKYITAPLAKILTSNATGQYYIEGETMYQKELAQTLKLIRDNGVAEFYNGTTGRLFIDDLQKQGGKMTLDNLRNYKAVVSNATEFKLNDDIKVLTQPVPGSGIVLGIILRIMQELGYYKNLKPKADSESANLYYHHLVEAFKFAYAQRAALEDRPDDPSRLEKLIAEITSDKFIKDASSKISDDKTHPSTFYGGLEYFQEDHGTAHTSVIDGDGNSIAVTTSVNLYFGSGLVSPSTGIIYNDVMDDFVSPNLTNKFQLPPTRYNRIRPGRRPISSMAPSIFVDAKGNPKLVIGASGGSKITTAIAMVTLRNLFFGDDIKIAIDSPRIHHQYLPDNVMFEANFPPEILGSLISRGHKLDVITGRSSVVMAIACDYKNSSKIITANSDYRKGGSVDGF